MMGFLFILVMWMTEFLSSFFKSEMSQKIFDLFSLISKINDLKMGVIKLAPVFYYIGIIIIFLFLTIRTVDKRRWTER
jgi:ABC-2 type transport system permease protein